MNLQLPKTLPAFIWHFIRPYTFIASIFVALAILAGFWGPFNNIIIKHIINLLPEVKAQNTSILTWPAALIVLNFIVFDNMTWRSIGYINYKYQAVIKNQIINETLGYTLNNTHQFFQDRLSGRIANQITTLADNLEQILNKISLDFIRGASVLIVAFITAYTVNQRFFFILFFWFIGFAGISLFMSKRLVYLADVNASQESQVSGQLVDCLTNHSNIRVFSRSTFELKRMRHYLRLSQQAFQARERYTVTLHGVQGLLIAIMMGFSAYFLVYLYGKGLVSMGDFALILGLSMELGHMMWFTMSRVDDFNQALGKAKELSKNNLNN